MRVISGTARGRKLKEFVGEDIRPTGDMVKESIFNIIQFDIEGRRVLDLFAGTGQLGIEALSRGAKSAIFIDSSRDAINLIKENIKLCGLADLATILMRDAISYLKRSEKFDLIFIDAPYATKLAETALGKIIEFDKLNENGIIVYETYVDSISPAVSPPYYLQKEYIYGKVKIVRYEYCGIPREL